MSQADLASTAPVPEPAVRVTKLKSAVSRAVLMLILVFLVGYILTQARTLWTEWQLFRTEISHARQNAVIGYVSINPNPSYAAFPAAFIREEGEHMLLWSGWKPGVGHAWFTVGRNEVDRDHLSQPMGRDVVQAIDWPLVEVGGGERWQRIPSDAPVVGMIVDDVPCAYPLLVLRKVEVVNDQVKEQPILVFCTPFVPEEEAVNVYDPILDGHRLTMGLSGYFHDSKPILYDRGTESLWLAQDGRLSAIAGPLKGKDLQTVAHPVRLSWNDWRSQHPQSRLLIGADRSKGIPMQ